MGPGSGGVATAFRADLDYYEDRARGLLASADDGIDGVVAVFGRWEAPLSEDGARLVLAREHGFDGWADFRGHVAALGAGAGRAFYRPHSGFPAWRPSSEPREILDEALSWAARNDRPEAVAPLVARGAHVDADVYRGTPLGWAAWRGRVAAVRRLLELGADPNARTTFGGPDHGEEATALHLAAERGHLDVIRALLRAGADPTIRDARHDGTPAGWAEHARQDAARALLS